LELEWEAVELEEATDSIPPNVGNAWTGKRNAPYARALEFINVDFLLLSTECFLLIDE